MMNTRLSRSISIGVLLVLLVSLAIAFGKTEEQAATFTQDPSEHTSHQTEPPATKKANCTEERDPSPDR